MAKRPTRADPGRLELIAPDPRLHGEAMIDLIAKCFGNYFRMRDDCRKGYVRNSHYDWQVSRIGLIDGRIVTHYGVWGYDMRIGAARVRVGGIAGVATHADSRKHGLMAKTAAATIEAMSQAGYDMTVLFGIPNFYHRFGYVRAWPHRRWTVKTNDLPKDRPTVQLRTFKLSRREKWRRQMEALYNREYARLTGTAVRPTYRAPGDSRDVCHYWLDGRDKMAGYVVVRGEEDRLRCQETCGDVEQVLRILGRLARRDGRREVRFESLPYDHPLCKRLRQGNCRVESYYSKSGGAMIRTLSLRSTLEKLTGELARRLKESHLATWRGRLLIADSREKVVLAVNRSKVRIAEDSRAPNAIAGGEEIAQLLISADEPAEIIEAGKMRTAGQGRQVAAVMFPNQHPILMKGDEF